MTNQTTTPGTPSLLIPDRRFGGRRDWAWLRAGVAVAAVGWGANQFAPLLLMYRTHLHLSAATVEATFGMYALGLIPGLLFGGPVSDRFGRRRVMLPALIFSVLGSVLLIAGGSALGLLFTGRLVAGIASGAAFSSGAAWIKELSTSGFGPASASGFGLASASGFGSGSDSGSVSDSVSDSGSGSASGDSVSGFAFGSGSGPCSTSGSVEEANPGPRRVTVTMTAGFAAGPLVAGLLAQWAPSPTVLPYLPHLVLVIIAIPLVLRTRETRAPNRRRSLRQQLRVPAVRDRRFRTVILPLAPWVFGSASIALAYLPGLVEARLGSHALVFSAVVATLTALAGIAVQPFARRMDRPNSPRLVGTAMAIVVAGLLISAAAAAVSQPALIVLAALALGAGYGCCQVCGLLEVQRLARPDDLAGLTAVYQAISYLGFAAPFVLAATQHAVPPSVLLLVVAGIATLALACSIRGSASRQPSQGEQA